MTNKRPPVFMADFDDFADYGHVEVSYLDLYPGEEHRPTGADPNFPGTPSHALKLLVVRGRRFLPVDPGMWLGVRVHSTNQILAPVTLGRTDDNESVNLWRETHGQETSAAPDNIDERLAWEIAAEENSVIAHRVDRQLRDAGGSGFFDPFVVQGDPDSDIPTLKGSTFLGGDRLTIYRRRLRLPASFHSKDVDPITTGTGTYAQNAVEASDVVLMWRTTAESILRNSTPELGDGQPIEWTWHSE